MALDIAIGSADQSVGAGTLDIIMGDQADEPGALCRFTLPETTVTSVLLACVVHEFPISRADGISQTWTVDPKADGLGASGFYLTILKRTSDRTSGSLVGDLLDLFSPAEQDILGCLVQVFGALEDTVIESVSHGAFTADTNPSFPAVSVGRAKNNLLGIVASTTELTFEANGDLVEEEMYSNSDDPVRALGVYKRVAGTTGDEVDVGSVSASGEATGRTWSISLRYEFRGSSHAARIHPTNITNPSRHARRT